MERCGLLLCGCPLAGGSGLEFGPLVNPVVRCDIPRTIRWLDEPVACTNEFLLQIERR
ncbi:MAG: hypothetical protein ACKO4T_02565 [Planctomycetaceae bacterium]